MDPWLSATGEPLRGLVHNILGFIEGMERRRRARKVRDQRALERCVEAVVVNIAYAALFPTEAGRSVVVSLATGKKRTRYDHHGMPTKTLRKVIKRLNDSPVLDLSVGAWTLRRTSTIAATDWFVRLMAEKGVSEADFGRHEGQELIMLTRTEKEFRHDHEGNYRPHKKTIWVDYRDTDETRARRSEMACLNQFLDQANIDFIDDGLLPRVDASQRTLRRYFSLRGGPRKEALGRNGRLFGGFWLNLKKARRKNIRINAEPVALLDFSSMFVRLAYAAVGQEPPDGDLYDLSGFLKGYDNEEHRDGVKQGFNSLLNGGRAGDKDILRQLPEGTKAKAFRGAVERKHPALVPLFKGMPIGLSLMFTESRILLKTLDRLMEQDVVGLGLHDGLLVSASKAGVAEDAMRASAIEVCGTDLPIKVSHLV